MKKQVAVVDSIANFGEVFTNEREVKAMINLVHPNKIPYNEVWLEPACGDGAFLREIFNRKLRSAESESKGSDELLELNVAVAASSIYGMDIQKKNVNACIKKLCESASGFVKNQAVLLTVKHILTKNILCADYIPSPNNGKRLEIVEWIWSEAGSPHVKMVVHDYFKLRDNHSFVGERLIEEPTSIDKDQVTLFNVWDLSKVRRGKRRKAKTGGRT